MEALEPLSRYFLDKYLSGHRQQALKKLFPRADSLVSGKNLLDRAIYNYADAMTRGDFIEAFLSNQELQDLLPHSPPLAWDYAAIQILWLEESHIERFPQAKENLGEDLLYLLSCEKKVQAIEDKNLEKIHTSRFPFDQESLKDYIHFSQSYVRFQKDYPDLFLALEKPKRPFMPLSFQGSIEVKEVLFAQAYEKGWDLVEEGSLLLFESSKSLLQSFRFIDKKHYYFLVLDEDFEKQIKVQKNFPTDKLAFSSEEKAKDYLLEKEMARLDKSRWPALFEKEKRKAWMKQKISDSPSQIEEKLLFHALEQYPSPEKRPLSQGQLTLAHIVPQIIDGNNAPQRILDMLIEEASPEFSLQVFSCESLVPRKGVYPFSPFFSKASRERGPQRISQLKKRARIVLDDAKLKLENSALRLASSLQAREIDCAIFHEANIINLLTAKISDLPLKVFLQQSNSLLFPYFDLYIAPQDLPTKLAKKIRSFGTKLVVIPPAVDVRKNWEKEKTDLSPFGIPKQAKVLFTMSNHLERRMSLEMCQAVSMILEQNQNAYYALLGEVNLASQAKIRSQFSPTSQKRVRFLGSHPCPSQLGRSMHLYLNEFPVGSGFGLIEALGASLPIISFCNLKGNAIERIPQAYCGKDYCIYSQNIHDYVRLACKLLKDDTLYLKWQENAKRQYAFFSDQKRFVREVESAILELCKEKTRVRKTSLIQ